MVLAVVLDGATLDVPELVVDPVGLNQKVTPLDDAVF